MEEMKREAFSEVLSELVRCRGIKSEEATFRTLLALAEDGEILTLVDVLGLTEPEMMRRALAYTYEEIPTQLERRD